MRSMVKWVCQIVTHIRHRALVFDTRLFAGNTADDTLVTGGTFRFCRLICPCVKRRNIMLNDKRRSLLNSALFRADNRTEQKTISPFSLALIFTFDFAALFCAFSPEAPTAGAAAAPANAFVPLYLSSGRSSRRWHRSPVQNDALQRDRFSMTRNPEVLFTPRTDPGNMGRRQSRFKF